MRSISTEQLQQTVKYACVLQIVECIFAVGLFVVRRSPTLFVNNPMYIFGALLGLYGLKSRQDLYIFTHFAIVVMVTFVMLTWMTIEAVAEKTAIVLAIHAPTVIDVACSVPSLMLYNRWRKNPPPPPAPPTAPSMPPPQVIVTGGTPSALPVNMTVVTPPVAAAVSVGGPGLPLATALTTQGGRWEWWNDEEARWRIYDFETISRLNNARSVNETQVRVFIGSVEYAIDLVAELQTNTTTNKQRRIRYTPPGTASTANMSRDLQYDLNVRTELTQFWEDVLPQQSMNGLWLQYGLKDVDDGSDEFASVARLFRESMVRARIKRIVRIQNSLLVEKFHDFRARLDSDQSRINEVSTRRLFHGTRRWQNVPLICHDGFDKRFGDTDASANLYGKGCYFSSSAKYSNSYCCTDPATGQNVMFLTAVAVADYELGKKNEVVPGFKTGVESLARYDTTVENIDNPTIFVTYDNAQAVPLYMIYYTT